MTFTRILSLVFALALVSPVLAATKFAVNLDASQEVGTLVNPVNATGQGNLTLVDLGGGQFRWDYQVTISPEISFSTLTGMPVLENGGRPATGFHIHNAARGVNGSVIYGLFGPDHDNDNDIVAVLNPNNTSTFTGSWGATDGNPVGNINTHAPNSLLPALPGNDVPFYFNVHTGTNQGGETRGQIVAVPEPATLALVALGVLALGGLSRRRR